MATTVTSTIFKKLKSKASEIVATHSTASPEVVTVNHRLNGCPDNIYPVLRSTFALGKSEGAAASVGFLSNVVPGLQVRSWNSSQAILDGTGAASTGSPAIGRFDIIAERWHSFDG